MGEARIGGRVIAHKIGVNRQHATLICCAAFDLAGEPDEVDHLCRELARVEGWSPIAVRFWLARLWGERLVELRGTRPTAAGWAELNGGDGDGARRAA